MDETSFHVLDPNGDVILELHDDFETVTSIKVSSSVLSIATPVFRALFSGQFKEAKDLQDSKKAGEILRLELPDDDPAGMLLLCRMLHCKGRSEDFSKATPWQLMEASIVCDKYDCGEAVQSMIPPVVRPWFQRSAFRRSLAHRKAFVSYPFSLSYDDLLEKEESQEHSSLEEPTQEEQEESSGNSEDFLEDCFCKFHDCCCGG